MAYTFDGATSIISFDVSTTAFDVRDLWTEWVDWFVTSDNSKYLPAMRCVGGDPLPGSKELGLTYFMLNGWKIKPYEESHVLAVNGNIYSEDGSSPFTAVTGSYNVTIINTVSNLVDSTVQQLPEIEYASFDEVVTIDVDNGSAGIAYPTGTHVSPVNNLADAKTIATIRGFHAIKLHSDLTIATGQDVSGLTIKSDDWKILTIETGVNTEDTVFEKIDLYGELSGIYNILVDCYVEDVTNFLGWMRGGSIVHLELAPYVDPDPYTLGSSYFDDLIPMYANIPSVLVMNDDVRVSFTNCTDMCEIRSMTEGSVINAGLSGGKITIDSSCIGGDILISGVGTYENNSLLTVDQSGLTNEESPWFAIAADNNVAGTMGNKLNTASSGGVDLNDLADAVWSHLSATSLTAIVQFLSKSLTGKREIAKVGATWTLFVYDDDGVTAILNKQLKDVNGNEISDLAAGVLAQELMSGT